MNNSSNVLPDEIRREEYLGTKAQLPRQFEALAAVQGTVDCRRALSRVRRIGGARDVSVATLDGLARVELHEQT